MCLFRRHFLCSTLIMLSFAQVAREGMQLSSPVAPDGAVWPFGRMLAVKQRRVNRMQTKCLMPFHVGIDSFPSFRPRFFFFALTAPRIVRDRSYVKQSLCRVSASPSADSDAKKCIAHLVMREEALFDSTSGGVPTPQAMCSSLSSSLSCW